MLVGAVSAVEKLLAVVPVVVGSTGWGNWQLWALNECSVSAARRDGTALDSVLRRRCNPKQKGTHRGADRDGGGAGRRWNIR